MIQQQHFHLDDLGAIRKHPNDPWNLQCHLDVIFISVFSIRMDILFPVIWMEFHFSKLSISPDETHPNDQIPTLFFLLCEF